MLLPVMTLFPADRIITVAVALNRAAPKVMPLKLFPEKSNVLVPPEAPYPAWEVPLVTLSVKLTVVPPLEF